MKKWILIWLFVLMYLSVAGTVGAANPTIYTSLHNDYGRAGQGDSHGNLIINNVYRSGYIQHFRVFVPPGAVVITLEILEWDGQSAIAHHETPPVSTFGQITNKATSYTLASLEAADQFFQGEFSGGRLAILSDGFAAPYLSAARGGWLYVKIDPLIGWSTYYTSASFTVNADAYNSWYDHAGSNSDGSIDWENDIEGVTEYLEPSAKPGKPIVTPANNTIWTDGITQTITATSTKAVSIFGTFTSSNDIVNPLTDPRIPNATDFDISGSGTSLPVNLTGTAGGIVIYKYRFISTNASGLSDESGVYSYTIDLRPATPGSAVTVTPATRDVAKDAGTTTFSVSNTGTGTMPWTAQVISGSSWLSITSGASGNNAGNIICAFNTNTGTSARTGTIRVTSDGAIGSPVDVTVTQAGAFEQPVLSVSPTNRDVANNAGVTPFGVSNTGTGTMLWTAQVTSGSSWLSITSGASGNNAGTVTCAFNSNTSTSSRTGTVRITATGATGSPADVTVTQAGITQPVLYVSPVSRDVAKDAGITTFNVFNIGTGTMAWTAAVTSGGSWLSITSGASGSYSGTISCSYFANTTTSSRTATIRVTASSATGSPVDVTVTQAPTPIGCLAMIDGNLLLHIPNISYVDPISGTLSLLADFVYEFNPKYPTFTLFKLTNYNIINNPSDLCAASTLSSDFKIHVPDVLLPDGITHLWLNLEYDPAFSIEGNGYIFDATYEIISN